MQEVFNRSVNVLNRINSENAAAITVVYESGYVSPWDKTQSLRYYGFITDLRCRIDINSLEPSRLPDIPVGTSRTGKSELIRQSEYESERYEMQFLMRTTYQGWLPLFNFSLLNRRPFYVLDVLSYLTNQPAFSMSNDAQLGVRVLDVGYGNLGTSDEVVIYGSVREEVTSLPFESPIVTQSTENQTTVGTTSEIILAQTPLRKGAVIVNRAETAELTLSYNAIATPNQGIVLYPRGGAYEINQDNLYRGSISAISTEENTPISIAEFA